MIKPARTQSSTHTSICSPTNLNVLLSPSDKDTINNNFARLYENENCFRAIKPVTMEDPRQKSKHQSSDEEQEQESIISQESGQRPHDQQQYSCRKEPAVFVVDRIVMDYALSCKYHE